MDVPIDTGFFYLVETCLMACVVHRGNIILGCLHYGVYCKQTVVNNFNKN